MNRQFLFRMQNQEPEQKRTAQPDFKIRPMENQRLTNGTNFNMNTMYQRPAQMNEYEGENMTSLHAKLHQEADKIRKWKVQTELDIKEKDKKLSSASTQIETMKKSLLELQLDNERLSSRMQEEIDDRQEVMQKVSSTRELCNVLKSTAISLEDKMLRCETEKTELKYAGRETSQFLEDLNSKFENLRLSSENNHQTLLLKYEREKNESQEKDKLLTSKCEEGIAMINRLETDLKEKSGIVTELQAALLERNSTLERLRESFGEAEERNRILEKDLKNKEEDFKESAIRVLTIQDEKRELEGKLQTTETELHSLQGAKDKMCQEMTESCAKYEKELLCLKENEISLEKELEEELSKMKSCQTELQEAQSDIEKLKSSKDFLLIEKTELEMKIDLQNFELSNLRTDLDERKADMDRVDGEMSHLLKKLDKEHLYKFQLQDVEKDLEAKICSLKLEKAEQSQAISELEDKLESKENEVKCILSKESEQKKILHAEIELKEKELEDERTRITNLTKESDHAKEVAMGKDLELTSKSEEIEKLQGEIQEQKLLSEQYKMEAEQSKSEFEEFRKTYEDERKKTDELSNQLKGMNLENKEHGKSLTSQQKKLAAQTKQNKDLEKEMKSLKTGLSAEVKKNTDKEKAVKSMKEEIEGLKQINNDLKESKTEYKKELQALKDDCEENKKASEAAMQKAKEMQEIAKKETENAKALTERQLGEMMGTLDSYKQSSEKILADKDAEVRSLKNKLDALSTKNKSEKNSLKDENNKLSSNMKFLNVEKENLCKQLMETADENQSLKKKVQDLEKQMEENSLASRSPSFTPESRKPQMTQPTPPVAPVTPQKQHVTPWTPKTPKTPVLTKDNQSSGLKTPQRSILRASSSVSKRRKVAFLADDNVGDEDDDDDDPPSSSDDLMELEIETEKSKRSDKCPLTPVSTSRTQKISAIVELGRRMTPKRASTPLSKPLLTSTPKKKIPETPSTGTLTSLSEKSRGIESTLQKQPPRTPNIRNVPAKKTTSKFFTTSPKDKAASRTRIKDKSKKEHDGQFSWFDLDSIYGFNPED